MMEKWDYEWKNKYPGKKCHEMEEMSNHFHCILEIVEATNPVNDNGSDVGIPAGESLAHRSTSPLPGIRFSYREVCYVIGNCRE